ncbi:MAG: hypothetical protein R2839_04795 [Thermomicrobiales bacterium]
MIGHLNEIAAAIGDEEFSLAYRNHDFEFAPLDDGRDDDGTYHQ